MNDYKDPFRADRTLPVGSQRYIVYSNMKLSSQILLDRKVGLDVHMLSMHDDLNRAKLDYDDARAQPAFERAAFGIYDRDERRIVVEAPPVKPS